MNNLIIKRLKSNNKKITTHYKSKNRPENIIKNKNK